MLGYDRGQSRHGILKIRYTVGRRERETGIYVHLKI